MVVQMKTMGVGLGGVGTISGAEYSIKEADHYVFHRVDDRESGTYRSVYRLESHDLKKSFRFSVKGAFRWADGEFIVNRERIREECEL